MKKVKKSLLHIIAILIVLAFPPIVYNFMIEKQLYVFAFTGGIVYLLYTYYFVIKIKNNRSRIIFTGIFYLMSAVAIALFLFNIRIYASFVVIIINLAIQALFLVKNKRSMNEAAWGSYLISFIITLTLSLFFFFFIFLGIAASAMPSNHY